MTGISTAISSLFAQTIHPETGFCLILVRNGMAIGSMLPGLSQPLVAKKGDILYRINLGAHIQPVAGILHTQGPYHREYGVQVEFQVADPAHFLEIYLQGRDPVRLAVLDIQAAIQEYADRAIYESMHRTNIEAKATYAFSKEPDNLKAGLCIINVHNPMLGEDESHQTIDLSPIVTTNGKLPTVEGYTRDYELSVELSVTDPQHYRYVENTGVSPVERVTGSIHRALQSYTSQIFYEDLSDSQLRAIVEHALDTFSPQFTGSIKIVHILHFALGSDETYQPINQSPMLTIKGDITTIEDYVRSYELLVELRVTNYQTYRYLTHTQTEISLLERAKIAIDSELQQQGRQQHYENLTDLFIRSIVEHSFDTVTNQITECLAIVRVLHLAIGEDKTYQPTKLSPLLTVDNKLTSQEGYVCDYHLEVELLIKNQRKYQEFINESIDPLERARIAIQSELLKYAHGQSYENLAKTGLDHIVEQAFGDLPSRVMNDMEIVRVYEFSLKEPSEYINLGPRTLTITGTLITTDFRKRAYEMTVMLEVANAPVFIQLTRRGNDPLQLVSMAIEGSIQRAADGKTHDELSERDLPPAAFSAFTTFSDATIGGLKIAEAHKVKLQADTRIQEQKEIVHQTTTDKAKLEHQIELEKVESKLKFESAFQIELQEIELAERRHLREKNQYLFELEKKATAEAHQFRRDLAQQVLSQFTARINEDLEANVSLFEVVEGIKALHSVLQPAIPQNTNGNGNNKDNQLQSAQPPHNAALETGQSSYHISQTSSTSLVPKRNKKSIPNWGIELVEIPLPSTLRDLVDDQERAFQICDATEDGLFQETDILIKINGQRTYTLEALEAVLTTIQVDAQVKVMILRDEVRKLLTLASPYDVDVQQQASDDSSEQ